MVYFSIRVFPAFRSPLFRKVQTKCDGSKEKQVILALENLSPSSYRAPFYQSGEVSQIEARPGVNIRSNAPRERRARTVWHVDAGTTTANLIAGCRNQGLQSLVWQLLNTR